MRIVTRRRGPAASTLIAALVAAASTFCAFAAFCQSGVPAIRPAAPGEAYHAVSVDGGWCWFGDPRAISYAGVTYLGWVTSEGDLQVAAHDEISGATKVVTLERRFERDDHANPGLAALPSGELLVFYSRHNGANAYLRRCSDPPALDKWTPATTLSVTSPGTDRRARVTYPSPVLVPSENDALYLFWRGSDWKPHAARSTDGGATWERLGTLISRPGAGDDNRPYFKVAGGKSPGIHLAFTDGHPRNEPENSIYYACFRGDRFYGADDHMLGERSAGPLDPADADLVYDGASRGRAWVWDDAEDAEGRPAILFARFPTEPEHIYMYARWTGARWDVHQLCEAGSWMPQTPPGGDEREPHYSGGLVFDHANPNIVYLSRQPGPGEPFEIERWLTSDGGQSWTSTPVTRGSHAMNIRPVVARGHPPNRTGLYWLHGEYRHYTDYRLSVRTVDRANAAGPEGSLSPP